MPLSEELVKILACPETKEPVKLASRELVDNVNAAISQGKVVNRGGQQVSEAIQTGLVREDGKFMYPVREDIPQMLIEEAIPLEQIG